tara:strand:+ start:1084 stop:1227 length:144 start_codon:yes stop_codon:yes gene_type:complete
VAKIIYTQDTVNYMIKTNKNLVLQLDMMGKPEIKSVEGVQYYVFEVE